MVELFAALDFTRDPDPGRRSVPPVARREAPHVSRVERASQPGPLGRDSHPLRRIAAPLRRTESFPVAPARGDVRNAETSTFPRFRIRHRIEHRDYSQEPSDVASGSHARITPMSLRRAGRAPLDATQLYESATRELVLSPLSRAGEARFTGSCRPIPTTPVKLRHTGNRDDSASHGPYTSRRKTAAGGIPRCGNVHVSAFPEPIRGRVSAMRQHGNAHVSVLQARSKPVGEQADTALGRRKRIRFRKAETPSFPKRCHAMLGGGFRDVRGRIWNSGGGASGDAETFEGGKERPRPGDAGSRVGPEAVR